MNKKGLTLIELLIVIGIIAILAAGVIVAINPGRQFAQARDATREQHINLLQSSLASYRVSNQGWGDLEITDELTEICNTNEVDPGDCGDLADISDLVDDGHINQVPVDPQGGVDEYGTGYFLSSDGELVADKYENDFIGIGITEEEYTANTPDPEDMQWAYADCSDFETNGSFSGGSGTEADPYQITDIHELQAIACDTENHYLIENDIDALGTESWNNDKGWEPIQATVSSSNGSVDGGGNIISNLYIDRPNSSEDVGLFGNAEDIHITGIGLEDPNITGDEGPTGTLVGMTWNAVEESYSLGGSVLSNATTGGLIGISATDTVVDCFSSTQVEVDSDNSVGGLVGFLDGSTVDNSYSFSLVDDNNTATDPGGLIGEIYEYDSDPYVTNSYWNSDTTGQTDGVGSFGGSGDGAEEGVKERTTDQLQTPTEPDTEVDGDMVYEGWSDTIWNFRTSTDYPKLSIFE